MCECSPRQPIRQTLTEFPIDAIVTLGDLSVLDIRELEEIQTIPKFGIYGNHDSGTYLPELGIENLHLAVRELVGIRFGGFQGSVVYKNDSTAPMFTQEESVTLLTDFPAVDVFVSHAPPRGVHD